MPVERRKKSISELLGLKEQKLTLKELVLPIVAVLIILVTALIFLFPALGNISVLRSQLRDSKDLLTVLNKKYDQLQQIADGKTSIVIEDSFSNLNEFVPNAKPSMQTLLHISKLARMDGVEFSGLTLNPGKVKDSNKKDNKKSKNEPINKLQNFEVDFSIRGEKQDILKFITDLREVSPLMKIDHFSTSLESSALDSQKLYMSSSLKVLVFYQPQPESLPPLEKPLKKITDEEAQFLQSLSNYLFLSPTFKAEDKLIPRSPSNKTDPFAIATLTY